MADDENLRQDSDEELMRRYQDGEAACLQQLFARHARRVTAFFWCMFGDLAQAAELSQRTWLRVHRNRKTFAKTPLLLQSSSSASPTTTKGDGSERFVTWLYSQAVQLRRDSARAPVVQASQPGAARAVTDAASLVRALHDLPDSYREVVVLQSLIGLSLAEIAAVLGATESTVEQRLQQGYEQLAASDPNSDGAALDKQAIGKALISPELLDRAILPKPLELSARALIPVVAHDLRPARPTWPLYLAAVLVALVVMFVRHHLFR